MLGSSSLPFRWLMSSVHTCRHVLPAYAYVHISRVQKNPKKSPTCGESLLNMRGDKQETGAQQRAALMCTVSRQGCPQNGSACMHACMRASDRQAEQELHEPCHVGGLLSRAVDCVDAQSAERRGRAGHKRSWHAPEHCLDHRCRRFDRHLGRCHVC
jgi:hypothetical protein